MCFRIFGEDRIKQFNIQSGEELTVSFDVDAHEYNGRWFNQINAWKVDRVPAQQPASAAVPPFDAAPFPPQDAAPAQPAAEGSSADDLPF